ncbi:MAG: AAA family ATPase [Magnetococcus sp. YQC-5]
MRLNRIKIIQFRNLKDFEIRFDDRFSSHAIIGQNGCGKSNLLEALIMIFRDLDLNQPAALDYELDYTIRGYKVSIQALRGKRPNVQIDGQKKSATHLHDHARAYLPSHVFAYYSGKNARIESLFEQHIRRFGRLMRSSDEEKVPRFGEFALGDGTVFGPSGQDLLRRLFYCRGGHAQLVLLACLLSDDPVFKQILQDLNIESLDSALFILKQPHHLKTNLQEDDILQGDNRFWFARGTVVSEFLDKLWSLAVAPIDTTAQITVDFRGRTEKQEQIYLFLPDKEALKKLGDLVGSPEVFFRYAEGAYIGDLIDEVRITVKHRDAQGNICFDKLSEGELQLFTVLGLMRITSQDHCLFLLDEPDTHLNPIWKLRYFDDIERVIQPDSEAIIQGDSNILITTHDPIMLGSLKKEQVHIMRRDQKSIQVENPDADPQGMGVAGLLKSEMFGLRSTVDSETLRRMDRRNALFAKGRQRNTDEDEELTRLSAELSDLGFAADFRDPTYALFVRKMAQHTKFHKELLTPEEQREQNAIADKIIDEILREERQA